MKIFDLLALSFENLRRRIGRTSLTIIGVVVGTCSIVVMVSLGIAMNAGFEEMIADWGDLTQIEVYNWGSSGGNSLKLSDEVVHEFGAYEHVKVATPLYQSNYLSAQVVAGKQDRYVMEYSPVMGIYPEAIPLLEYELLSGQYLPIQAPAAANKKKVQVLLGEKVGYGFRDSKRRGEKAYRYEGATDASGNLLAPFVDVNNDTLTLKLVIQGAGTEASSREIRYTLETYGVMKEDYKKGQATSMGIVMDLNVLKRLEKEYIKAAGIKVDKEQEGGYNSVTVKVDSVDNVEAVEKQITDLGYHTFSMSSERERMQKQSQTMQLVLGGLGAVSLFVAALSIANTMTMAIYERTREIGVMKVLGCKLNKIRLMFLMEAAMIGLLGGLFGVAVSYGLSFLLNTFGPQLMQMGLGSFLQMTGSTVSIIPPWLALVGVGFSTVIGILSGIMPANRAVQISALEAIRHE